MNFWQTLAIAFLASLPPTLTALASLIQAVRNAKKSDEIHAIVNGSAEIEKQKAFTAGVRVGASGDSEENRRHTDR